jgi:DNA polymerase-3 subunit epsilon
LREVYINLLDIKEPKLMFTNDNSEMNLQNRKVVKNNYCKVIVKPTKEELELHTDFLKKELKKNYY